MAKKIKKLSFYEAIGRRKKSTARVRLYLATKNEVKIFEHKYKKGDMIVNKRPIDNYFPLAVDKVLYLRPLELTDSKDRFVISAIIKGGGKNSQLEAYILGLSRALLLTDEQYRPVLKKPGLLRVDARVKERRKPGTGGKARRKKQSPKR